MSPKHLANPLHGILLIVLFSFSAFYIADFEWVKHLSLSPLIVGIVLGMLYANSLRNHLPETWVPGIQFCTKQVLRTGIVLYGFKLTFQSVIDIGGSALALDLIVVTLTILLGAGLGRLLKMDRDTALLTSIGNELITARMSFRGRTSRSGGGTRRQKQTLQSRCGRFHRGHLRHALHVSVSSPAPGRNTGSDAGTNGAFYRSHPS